MDRDFALRQNAHYHNPAMTLVFNAVYQSQVGPNDVVSGPPSTTMFSDYTYGTAAPMVKPLPAWPHRPQGQRPYLDHTSHVNPMERQWYNLPKKAPNAYFDPEGDMQVRFKNMPATPEVPQAHLLFLN